MITEIKQYKTSNGTIFENKETAQIYDQIQNWLPSNGWTIENDYMVLSLNYNSVCDLFAVPEFDYDVDIIVNFDDLVVKIQFEDYQESVSRTYEDVKRFYDDGIHSYSNCDRLVLSFELPFPSTYNEFKAKLITAFQLTAKHFRNN